MKIGKKFHVMSIIFTITSVAVISILWNQISTLTFYSAENKVFEHRLQNLENQFQNLEKQLNYITLDWSKWDDAYEFLQNNNEKFIERNLLKNTFTDLELNYILIFNNKNELLYNNYYNEEKDALNPINKKEINVFSTYRNQTGLLSIDEKVVLYSSINVTNSEGTSKQNGHIVFAYDFNKNVINKLSENLGLPITVGLEYNSSLDKIETTFKRLDKKKTLGSVIIPVLNKDANLKLNTSLSNEISELGFKNSRQFLLILLAVLVVFEIIVYLLLNEKIIKRVLHINNQLKKITNNKDINLRVHMDGRDELTELKDSINSMLTEIEYMQNELKQHATIDEMTGVHNKRSGLSRLKEHVEQCKISKSILTICYIDINGLKKINDTLGHFYGDLLIKDFSKLLIKVLPKEDIVRLGGDEFLLVLYKYDVQSTKVVLEKLIRYVDKFNTKNIRPYKLNFSFGIESYDNNMSIDDFIRKADIKMYKHKNLYKEDNESL